MSFIEKLSKGSNESNESGERHKTLVGKGRRLGNEARAAVWSDKTNNGISGKKKSVRNATPNGALHRLKQRRH